MPSGTATVGGLTVPVPAGTQNTELADPAVRVLLDFLGWSIANGLDAKLTNMQGTSASACPSANRFPFNPQTYFVRNSIPALYVWWAGRSRPGRYSTTVRSSRERDIDAMYVFDELIAPDGFDTRHGLLAAVDAIFHRCADWGRHPNYGYNGAAAGTAARLSAGLIDWAYQGATEGRMAAQIPSTSSAVGGPPEGHVVRGYPALLGRFTVLEHIETLSLEDPADVMGDLEAVIRTSEGDPGDVIDYMTRYAPGPDGEGEQEEGL